VRRLLIGGSPFQGRCPASEVNDGDCPEKPDHLRTDSHGAYVSRQTDSGGDIDVAEF
jgi:hypothetical protein